MRFFFLALMWICPAVIAGVLGWRGIWGGTSAFADYLIPIPVAGGVLHVPSFVVASMLILSMKKYPEALARFVPVAAVAVYLLAQSMQIDFERLNAWFFTDYSPARSPLRFDGNPLFLFIASDAFWVAMYGLANGFRASARYFVATLLIPVLVIIAGALYYKGAGPKFDYGYNRPTQDRGNSVAMVYTASKFNEKLYLDWLNTKNVIEKPWTRSGVENQAVLFTRSMQDIKWGKLDVTDNVVATVCLYEENETTVTYAGYADCFEGRVTFAERLNNSFKEVEKTGLGREIDSWYVRARLCDGVEVPETHRYGVELYEFCSRMQSGFDRERKKLLENYGEDSEQVKFLDANKSLVGL